MTRVQSRAEATPTKDFFINIITRDISIEDCILDLLDNSLDGARRVVLRRNGDTESETAYEGYKISITFQDDSFEILDNCGGISIESAEKYAFHFGRRHGNNDGTTQGGIGLYGIGMKRALFKLGSKLEVQSSTGSEAFLMHVDVNSWASDETSWDFPIEVERPTTIPVGTEIRVRGLRQGVQEQLSDPHFQNRLYRTIARDYSVFLQKGVRIEVNGATVKAFIFKLRTGEGFAPHKQEWVDEETGVHVQVMAGMAAPPPDDIGPELEYPRADIYGWYVICNDRVVLAADKTERTVWGRTPVPRFHTQYYGFLGLVSFSSEDSMRLPWNTTKRQIDETSGLYRRAQNEMVELTRGFTSYTNVRGDQLNEAKSAEQKSTPVPIKQLPAAKLQFPKLPRQTTAKVEVVKISYSRPKSEVRSVAKALGDEDLAPKEIGIRTYEYFLEREVEQ